MYVNHRRRLGALLALALVAQLASTGTSAAHARAGSGIPADGLKRGNPTDGFKHGTAPYGFERGTAPYALQRGASPQAALAAGPQPFLAGLSSQQQPVLLRFNADASALTRALTTLRFTCTSGASFFQPDDFSNLRVSTLRHFRSSFSVPPQTVNATTSIALSGAIGGQVDKTHSRASGTWQQTLVERNPATNAVTDTCTSGVMRFSVHR
jgi:hypothetical protein